MQFDKAIRSGLARQSAAPATVHPEADLLTAFVEQALSQPERQQVLQHLSVCGDCREVIALSLPQIEVAPAVAAQPSKSLWTNWLVVRWAAAAAAVAVVAGTVTLYRSVDQAHPTASIVDGPAYIASQQAKQTPSAESQIAKSEPQPEAPRTEANPQAKADNAATRHQSESPALMANAAPVDRVPPSALSSVAASAQKKDSGRADQMLAKSQPAPVPAPPVTVAESQSPKIQTLADAVPLEKPVPVQGAMTASMGASSNSVFPSGTGRALRPSDEPALQTYTQDAGTFSLSAAEPPPKRGIVFGGRGTEAAKTLARREPLGVGMFSTAPAPMPNAPSLNRRWQVTADGQLQRSHAIGEQFHPVHVADGIFFKAVAENGSEVWAGGIGGALYHSTDDGKSWMKVMPSAGDQPLIADVVAIRATGRGAAELNTSKGERWITVDGGQHWMRHE